MRWWRHLLCLGLLAGCAPGGGGGGGDCREADEACSEGARCVAVSAVGYACRAICGGDGDCLRDERCEGGLCLDRAAPTLDGAVVERDAVVLDPPPDVGVDGPLVRVVDEGVEPPVADRGVVVLPPLDGGVDPEACAGRFDASGDWLLGVRLGFAPGSPLFFQVELSLGAGGRMAMRFMPLRTRDRAPIEDEVVEIEGVAVDAEGYFAAGPLRLRSPAEANRLGGDVEFEVTLTGALRPTGALCGAGEGVSVQPPGRRLDGTVFAFAPWEASIAAVDPFVACDGCLPEQAIGIGARRAPDDGGGR